MAQKQDFGTKLILWLFVYWWFYPLKWIFYTVPHSIIMKRKAKKPQEFTVNLNSFIAHRRTCACIREKEADFEKLAELTCTWTELANMGYQPCGRCHPDKL